MSIKLVLAHYLSSLREREELDALLPDLLLAMGHSVLSRPQLGVVQAGVDVVSTCTDGDGNVVVFLFVIKFGNVGRDGFFGGPQSVSSSIQEASLVYTRSRLPAEYKTCRKKIVLVSNGEMKQDAPEAFAALTKEVGRRRHQSLHFWGIDQLTPLIEKHVFDESLLLARGNGDLRAALSTLEETEPSVHRFVRFVDSCMEPPASERPASPSTEKERFLRRWAAAAMGWAVLLGWGRSEGNLKPGVVGGEYLLLRLWADAVRAGQESNPEVQRRLKHLMGLQGNALLRYYEKLGPQLVHRRELLAYRREHVFYADLVFEELGRLAIAVLLWQHTKGGEKERDAFKQLLVEFMHQHSGLRLPVLDGQAIDLSLAFMALVGAGDKVSAKGLLQVTTQALAVALLSNHWLPVDSDSIEDAVALHEGKVDQREYFKTSTLVPLLGTMAGLLDDQESLNRLNEDVLPRLDGVTLERWGPCAELETFTGSSLHLTGIGISKALAGLEKMPLLEVQASVKTVAGAAEHDQFKWANTTFELLAAVSARFHRHPVPSFYLAKRMLIGTALERKVDEPQSAVVPLNAEARDAGWDNRAAKVRSRPRKKK